MRLDQVFTDDQRENTKNSRAERAKRRLVKFKNLPEGNDEIPFSVRKLCDYWANDSPWKKPRTEKKKQQPTYTPPPKQPCTIMNGKMTSASVTMKLPPLPQKLGLFLEFDPVFGFVELKFTSLASPILAQIPVDFRKDSFITSIESNDFDLGYVVPMSGRHCVDTLAMARKGEGEKKVVINFAKNPSVIFSEAFHHVPNMLAQDHENKETISSIYECGQHKTNEAFSSSQWSKAKPMCSECQKIKFDLGSQQYKAFMSQTTPLRDIPTVAPQKNAPPPAKQATPKPSYHMQQSVESRVVKPLWNQPLVVQPLWNAWDKDYFTKMCVGPCGKTKVIGKFSSSQWGNSRSVCLECSSMLSDPNQYRASFAARFKR